MRNWEYMRKLSCSYGFWRDEESFFFFFFPQISSSSGGLNIAVHFSIWQYLTSEGMGNLCWDFKRVCVNEGSDMYYFSFWSCFTISSYVEYLYTNQINALLLLELLQKGKKAVLGVRQWVI